MNHVHAFPVPHRAVPESGNRSALEYCAEEDSNIPAGYYRTADIECPTKRFRDPEVAIVEE